MLWKDGDMHRDGERFWLSNGRLGSSKDQLEYETEFSVAWPSQIARFQQYSYYLAKRNRPPNRTPATSKTDPCNHHNGSLQSPERIPAT